MVFFFFSWFSFFFLSSATVFNIQILLNIFELQITILELILKDHVTLKTDVNVKIQLCITGIKYI